MLFRSSVMANIIPKDTHNLVAAFMEGRLDESRRLQLGTLDLIKALFIETSPVPIKTAMNLLGMNVGECRMPLINMEEKNLSYLKKALTAYGLL